MESKRRLVSHLHDTSKMAQQAEVEQGRPGKEKAKKNSPSITVHSGGQEGWAVLHPSGATGARRGHKSLGTLTGAVLAWEGENACRSEARADVRSGDSLEKARGIRE